MQRLSAIATRSSLVCLWLLMAFTMTAHAPCGLPQEPVAQLERTEDRRMVKTSAYTAGDDFTEGVIMANGEKVHEGSVAYNDAPLGTKILLDGEVYTVKDRVAKDGVVDIYMDSYEEAIKYGVKQKEIIVLE